MADAKLDGIRGGLEALCSRLDGLRGDLDGIGGSFADHLREDLGMDMGEQSSRGDFAAVIEATVALEAAHVSLREAVRLMEEGE